jgi:hypothetical protein
VSSGGILSGAPIALPATPGTFGQSDGQNMRQAKKLQPTLYQTEGA